MAKFFGWRVSGTELLEDSRQIASELLRKNGVACEILPGRPDQLLISQDRYSQLSRADVVICNPPFFASMEEKRHLQKENFESKPEEVSCEGGELEFVSRIVRESLGQTSPPDLFAIYVGRKETLSELQRRFSGEGRIKLFSETLYQGKTARWVLFWRFVTAGRSGSCSSAPDTRRAPQTTSRCGERGRRAGS